jgi:hypothetical protein
MPEVQHEQLHWFLWRIKVWKKIELQQAKGLTQKFGPKQPWNPAHSSQSNTDRINSTFEKYLRFRLLLQISKRFTVQMHLGKRQQNSQCFQLLKSTNNFLHPTFFYAYSNFNNTSRVLAIQAQCWSYRVLRDVWFDCLQLQGLWRLPWTPDSFSTARTGLLGLFILSGTIIERLQRTSALLEMAPSPGLQPVEAARKGICNSDPNPSLSCPVPLSATVTPIWASSLTGKRYGMNSEKLFKG